MYNLELTTSSSNLYFEYIQEPVGSIGKKIIKHATNTKKTFVIASLAVASFLYFVCTRLAEKIKYFIAWLFCHEYTDINKLISSRRSIPTHYHEWFKNFSLLRSIHDRTNDPEVQQLTQFLAANYLYASTSIDVDLNLMLGSSLNIQKDSHVTPYFSHHYHRYAPIHNPNLAASLNKQFVLQKTSPLIPTDTKEFSDLLPLFFTVLNKENQESWTELLRSALEKHFSEHGFEEPLQPDFLLDASDFLAAHMKLNDSSSFNHEYTLLKTALNQAIENVLPLFPHLQGKLLRKFIQKHTTGIARLDIEEFGGIKLLPLFHKNEANQFVKKHPSFSHFLTSSGIMMNSVNFRRHFINPFSDYSDVHLGTQETTMTNPILTPVCQKAIFARLQDALSAHDNLAIRTLGLATTKLIEGLESKIDYDAIDPSKKELVFQILFQLFIHVSDAERALDREFQVFTANIKLIHYDLMALLEITKPYSPAEFENLYLSHLTEITDGHKATAGLCKTGMTLFTGIQKALTNPVIALAENTYFEFINDAEGDRTIEHILSDPNVSKVDLFIGQFNPNINIATDFTHYRVTPIADHINDIFSQKPETDSLTVAIDCTIDYIDSPKVQELIAQFKPEIDSGRINFVFFRSGMKFDMFGMDNYYGAPYLTINNGDRKWNSFVNTLSTHPALQTDNLSLQWFCLTNEYTFDELYDYRKLIFDNTKEILSDLPPSQNTGIRINTVDDAMDACFIDIKVLGPLHHKRAELIAGAFYKYCTAHNISLTSRASFGFHHANINIILFKHADGSTSIRLNPGIDPRENALLKEFLIEHVLN